MKTGDARRGRPFSPQPLNAIRLRSSLLIFAFLLVIPQFVSAQASEEEEKIVAQLISDRFIISVDIPRSTVTMKEEVWRDLYLKDKKWIAKFLAGYIAHSLGRQLLFVKFIDEKSRVFVKWSSALKFKTLYSI